MCATATNLLTTILVLASALAMSVAIAPGHAQTTNPCAPPAAPQVNPSAPEEVGPDAKPADALKAIACPPQHICLFQHTRYRGHIAPFGSSGSSDLKRQNFNDGTSSIRNNSNHGWCVYEHPNYGGISAYVKPTSAYGRLHSFWNDRISSLRRVASPDSCAAPG